MSIDGSQGLVRELGRWSQKSASVIEQVRGCTLQAAKYRGVQSL
jgi:hypothetical protein